VTGTFDFEGGTDGGKKIPSVVINMGSFNCRGGSLHSPIQDQSNEEAHRRREAHSPHQQKKGYVVHIKINSLLGLVTAFSLV